MTAARIADNIVVKWLQAAAAVMVILGGAIAGIDWLAGGLHPGSEVQVGAIADQVSQLRTEIGALTKQVGELPRTQDYALHEQHLSRLDTQVGSLVDRLTHDEIDESGLTQQVHQQGQQLQTLMSGTGTPVRNPR